VADKLDIIINQARKFALARAMVSSVLSDAEISDWAEKYASNDEEKERIQSAISEEFNKRSTERVTPIDAERTAKGVKADTFENSLKKWFKQYHISKMSADQRARWYDLRGKRFEIAPNGNKIFLDDKRSAAQKGWGDPKTGELLDTVPDLTLELDDPGWDEFYRVVQNTLRSMDDDRTELSRADPENGTATLDKYFGKKGLKPFSKPQLDPSKDAGAISTIANIKRELDAKGIIYDYLENLPDYNKIFTKEYPITQFAKDLSDKDFMGNSKCREHLRLVAIRLQDYVENSVATIDDSSLEDKRDRIRRIKQLGDLTKLSARMNPENDEVTPDQMQMFKQPEFYQELLKDFYDKEDKENKSAFFKQFEKYNGNKLTGYMSYALEKSNYSSGDNQLVPKYEEKRNVVQTVQKKWDDWREQHIEKLWKKQHSHIYSAPNAQGIVAAICKAKISPTDGILKVLEKKDELRPKIQAKSTASLKGFDFLMASLTEMKNSGEMDKALEGALRNGAKCQAIAMEIIKRGVKHREVEKAKVALEVLAVMRYDTFSSAHYNEIFKDKFDPLKDASFMKHEGVKQVVGAATTGLNLLMKGGYKLAIAGRNKYQFRRGKVKLDNKRLTDGISDAKRDSKNRIMGGRRYPEKVSPEGFNYWDETKERLNRANEDLRIAEDAARPMQGLDALEDIITSCEARLARYYKLSEVRRELDELIEAERHIEEQKEVLEVKAEAEGELTEREEAQYLRLEQQLKPLAKRKQLLENEIGDYKDLRNDEQARRLEEYVEKRKVDYANEEARLEGLQITKEKQYTVRRNLLIAQNEKQYAEAAHNIRNTKKEKDEAKATDSKPAKREADEMTKFDELVFFWNYVNGYTGAKVNDHNIFRSSKTIREEADPTNNFDKRWMKTSGYLATHDYDRAA